MTPEFWGPVIGIAVGLAYLWIVTRWLEERDRR